MGGPLAPVVLLGSFFVLLVLGVPVAYALGMAALAGAFYAGLPLEAIFLKVSDSVDDFALLAIPFFVFAGALMAEGGMARRLVAFANIFVGFMRGGLAMVNVLASMFFGGVSGSAVADTSSIGSIMIPMMKKQGYDDHFSVNLTISGATRESSSRRATTPSSIPTPPAARCRWRSCSWPASSPASWSACR